MILGEGLLFKVDHAEFSNCVQTVNLHPEFITKRSIENSKESLKFFQATLNGAVDGIIVFDCKKNICQYNCKFMEMWNVDELTLVTTDYENLLGIMMEQLKKPEEYLENEKKLYAQLEKESCNDFERKDGRIFERYSKPQWFEGQVVGRVVSFRDITKYKDVEKGMAHLERMNIIGEMAAGIGHEVRNPMTTIRGFLQILLNKRECVRQWEYYALMIEELDRANGIITEFLSLAKETIIRPQSQNLNEIIRSLILLIEADAIIANKYIKLELTSIPELLLDGKEIRQLILNLVRNGLDAMAPGTYITIMTYIESDKVVLAIKDQGGGIAPEVLKKIGKAFFTTKEQGTGLGLAICYSIAERHNATITIETGEQGTTFFVRFNTALATVPCA